MTNKIIKVSGLLFVIIFCAIGIFIIKNGKSHEKYQFSFDMKGVEKIHAASADWNGVRGIASLTKAVNETMKSIANAIITSGVMNAPGTSYTATISWQATPFFVKIYKGANVNVNGKIYPNVLEEWQGTAIVPANKSLEFFFDDISEPAKGVGVLMRIAPGYYDATTYNAGEMYEMVSSIDATQKRFQVISYSGAPFKSFAIVNQGKVKVIDETSYITFSSMTQVTATAIVPICLATSGNFYYTLVFAANTADPYYSTALHGVMADPGGTNPIATSQACAVANPTNYGYFNVQSNVGTFENDGQNTDDGVHPPITAVNGLLTTLQNDPEFSKTNIDAINIVFVNTSSVSP